jgi:hypothetical protein
MWAAEQALAAQGMVDGSLARGTAAYEAYLQEMLNATTQGIASGVGTFSEAGEPAGVRELTLAEKLRDGFTPGDGARPIAKVTEESSGVGPPPRGTAAYDAYLREMLNGTTQGVVPGVGSFSEAGEPARRTGARDLTLAEKLRDGFTPGSGARPTTKVPEESSGFGPPPRGTAAYDAYLTEMLNGTTQGIAPGVGSFSEVGEPARRTGPRELTLAEELRDGFTPGSGARVVTRTGWASG